MSSAVAMAPDPVRTPKTLRRWPRQFVKAVDKYTKFRDQYVSVIKFTAKTAQDDDMDNESPALILEGAEEIKKLILISDVAYYSQREAMEKHFKTCTSKVLKELLGIHMVCLDEKRSHTVRLNIGFFVEVLEKRTAEIVSKLRFLAQVCELHAYLAADTDMTFRPDFSIGLTALRAEIRSNVSHRSVTDVISRIKSGELQTPEESRHYHIALFDVERFRKSYLKICARSMLYELRNLWHGIITEADLRVNEQTLAQYLTTRWCHDYVAAIRPLTIALLTTHPFVKKYAQLGNVKRIRLEPEMRIEYPLEKYDWISDYAGTLKKLRIACTLLLDSGLPWIIKTIETTHLPVMDTHIGCSFSRWADVIPELANWIKGAVSSLDLIKKALPNAEIFRSMMVNRLHEDVPEDDLIPIMQIGMCNLLKQKGKVQYKSKDSKEFARDTLDALITRTNAVSLGKRKREDFETYNKSVECPVCMESKFLRVKVCANNHHLCNQCAQHHRISKCPICRAPKKLGPVEFNRPILSE